MMNRTLLLGGCFLAAVTLAGACESLPQGAEGKGAGTGIETLSFQVSTTHLDVALARGPAQIRVEVVAGEERPDDWHGDPEIDGPFVADVLVSDRNGYPCLAEYGADALMVEEWRDRYLVPPDAVRTDERRADLELLLDALESLAADPEVHALYRWQLRSLRSMAVDVLGDETFYGGVVEGEPTPDFSELDEAVATHIEPAGPTPWITPRVQREDGYGVKLGALSSSTAYRHRGNIRKASCCWSFGEHSAVQLRVYNSGGTTLLTTVNTNNHGRGASHSSMSSASGCPKTWTGRTNYLPPLQPYKSVDTYGDGNAGGCKTAYDSVWPTSGKHVCNDDSLAEYSNVKYNAGATWATCGDSTLRKSSPTCD